MPHLKNIPYCRAEGDLSNAAPKAIEQCREEGDFSGSELNVCA
jgi:hypothetical protein